METLPRAIARKLPQLLLKLGPASSDRTIPQPTDTEPNRDRPIEPTDDSHRALPGSYGTSPYVRQDFSSRSTSTEGGQSPAKSDPTFSSATEYEDKIALESEDLRIISVLIKGSHFVLAEFDAKKLTTHGFFQDLSKCYIQYRGFLRSWLSIYVFGSCEYSKVSNQ